MKRAAFYAIAIVVAVVGIFLVLTGQFKALARAVSELNIRKRSIEIDDLDARRDALQGLADKDGAAIKALEEQGAKLEKENAAERLRIRGLSHDEIVQELAARGL